MFSMIAMARNPLVRKNDRRHRRRALRTNRRYSATDMLHKLYCKRLPKKHNQMLQQADSMPRRSDFLYRGLVLRFYQIEDACERRIRLPRQLQLK